MSLSSKTKRWLSKNCPQSLAGKTVLVTGANSGVGFKETEELVYLGAKVIMACRNLKKAEEARNCLLSEYPEAEIDILELDLASFQSIDRFTEQVRDISLDMFINNAGVFHRPGKKTADGFELVIGTNYIGTYYLTERLLPFLKARNYPVFYINTISIIHKIASVDFRDFYCEKNYGNFRVYGRSKICEARYTYNLAMKYKDTNVCILMNHPGMCITPMGLNAYGPAVGKLAVYMKYLLNSAERSALSAAYIMEKPVEAGSIVGPNILFGGWGYPKRNNVYKKVKSGAEELREFTQKEIQKHKKGL